MPGSIAKLTSIDIKIDYYLKMADKNLTQRDTLHHDMNVLNYWNDNQDIMPLLVQLARGVLCIPATVVSVHGVLSVTGNIVSETWSVMNTAHGE